MMQDGGRDGYGRFVKGRRGKAGPGRPKGSENRTTRDARHVKRAVLESWNREPTGAELLEQLKRRNPTAYLRLVVGLLPKNEPESPPPVDLRVSVGPDRDV